MWYKYKMNFMFIFSARLLLSLSLLILLFAALASCKDQDNSDINKVASQIEDLVVDAKNQISEITPKIQKMTSDEIGKLFSFEYRVVDVYGSVKEIEAALNEFGKDRWECFSITQDGEQHRLYLKRHPSSYLRYVPRIVP
jgi:hypothetical protein